MVHYSKIQEAQGVLDGIIHQTPVLTSAYLNERSGATVFLKCENIQRTGAFKLRGAYNAVAHVVQKSRDCPIIALSSGNHAQGVALACSLHGMAAHIVMPEPRNQIKLDATTEYGATVHRVSSRAEGEQLAQELVERLRGHFIPAFNDSHVIAGQGTAALEFLTVKPDLDILLAPVGGGGLLAGICIAAHGLNSGIRVYGGEPARALDAVHSVRENRIVVPVPNDTIAEGLRTSLGDITLEILREHVEGFFVVEEQEIIEAMQVVYERLKIVIEPSSAVAFVPLLRQEPALQGKQVGVIVTGGNVDLTVFFESLAVP